MPRAWYVCARSTPHRHRRGKSTKCWDTVPARPGVGATARLTGNARGRCEEERVRRGGRSAQRKSQRSDQIGQTSGDVSLLGAIVQLRTSTFSDCVSRNLFLRGVSPSSSDNPIEARISAWAMPEPPKRSLSTCARASCTSRHDPRNTQRTTIMTTEQPRRPRLRTHGTLVAQSTLQDVRTYRPMFVLTYVSALATATHKNVCTYVRTLLLSLTSGGLLGNRLAQSAEDLRRMLVVLGRVRGRTPQPV